MAVTETNINKLLDELLGPTPKGPSEPSRPPMSDEEKAKLFEAVTTPESVPLPAPRPAEAPSVDAEAPPPPEPAPATPVEPASMPTEPSPPGTETPSESDTKRTLPEWLSLAAENLPSAEQIGQTAEFATRPQRQFAAKAAGGIASLPYYGAAAMTLPAAALERVFTGEGGASQTAVAGHLQTMAKLQKNIDELFGVSEPETPLEELGAGVGKAVTPAGKFTVPLTLATAGVTGIVDKLFGPEKPTAVTGLPAYEAAHQKGVLDWMFPQAQAAAGTDVKWPDAPAPAASDQTPVMIGTTPALVTTPGKKVEVTSLGVMEQSPILRDVKTQIQTSGGPTKLSASELASIGVIPATMIGAIFVPSIMRRLAGGAVPRLRDVENAAPGTVTLSNNTDYLRMADDVSRALIRQAERAGVPPAEIATLQGMFNTQTRTQAGTRADAAIQLGESNFMDRNFNVQTPMSELLERTRGTNFNEYLNYLNARDAINEAVRQGPGTGPIPTPGGYDYANVQLRIRQLEAANPEFRQYANAFRDNLRELRRVEATGEGATISRAEERELNTYRPYELPGMNNQDALQAAANDMRKRLIVMQENAFKVAYVDQMNQAMSRLSPQRVGANRVERYFTQVMPEEFSGPEALNPEWKPNTLTLKRRGVTEHYTGDPMNVDIMKFDPYQIASSNPFFMTKRGLEIGATGLLAPWFAVTSAIRNYGQIKVNVPPGIQSATILGTMRAVPQQVLPDMARAIAISLDRGSAGWLTQTFGRGHLDAISTRLAHHLMDYYNNSPQRIIRTSGGMETGMLGRDVAARQVGRAQTAIENAIEFADRTPGLQQTAGVLRTIRDMYKAALRAGHEAPAFAATVRNIRAGVPPNEAIQAVRRASGDRTIVGQHAIGEEGRAIRFQPVTDTFGGRLAADATRLYGRVNEYARTAVPWYNTIVQSIKSHADSYWQHPYRFALKTAVYTQLPYALAYLLAHSSGKDKDGRSYVEHMMEGRSSYNTSANLYIPLPWRKAEEGIELPMPQELTLPGRLTQTALDHLMRTSIFDISDDVKRVLNGYGELTVVPPTPPLAGAALGMTGQALPMGMFGGGGAYTPRKDPFDQTGGLPTSLDLTMRAIMGGVADVVGASSAAFMQGVSNGGWVHGATSALQEGGERIISKTPIVRDITNVRAPMSGQTDVSAAFFAKKAAIDRIDRYAREFGLTGQRILEDPKQKSKVGRAIVEDTLGKLPVFNPGLNQPEPTNPIYMQVADTLHKFFKSDVPKVDPVNGRDVGGLGFLSFMQRYNTLTRMLRTLRNVNAGNTGLWQQDLNDEPGAKDFLQSNGVDTTKKIQVINFYEKKRQETMRVLYQVVKSAEKDISRRIGKPFKIEDAIPYRPEDSVIGADDEYAN